MAASASKTSTKRPFFEVASRRAAASPRERMATVRRGEGCRSVSMRKLHVLRAAQNLDRSLAGSLLDPGPAVYVRSLGPSKRLFLPGCKVRSSVEINFVPFD